MTAIEQAEEANERLEKLYAPYLELWRPLQEANPGMSIPMFLSTTPAYFAAKLRLMFVGQETHGWMNPCPVRPDDLTVKTIMDFYSDDEKTGFRETSQGPYWRAIRRIAPEVGVDDYRHALLTSNLFPCDSNKGQAPKALLETMRGWRLLPQEIEILKPEVVIFFAGPIYAYNLGCYFGTAVAPRLSASNLFQPYLPKDQDWKAWVTYHPASLQRAKKLRVLDRLIEAIQEEIS